MSYIPSAEKQRQIQSLTEQERLTMDEVRDLSAQCSSFIIPNHIDHAKRLGLILYNPIDRENGAAEEADKIEADLKGVGFDTVKKEWKSREDLFGAMDENLDEGNVANCSIVICCLMAHGRAGVVRGSNGDDFPVNNVLRQLESKLPPHLPSVRRRNIPTPVQVIDFSDRASLFGHGFIVKFKLKLVKNDGFVHHRDNNSRGYIFVLFSFLSTSEKILLIKILCSS